MSKPIPLNTPATQGEAKKFLFHLAGAGHHSVMADVSERLHQEGPKGKYANDYPEADHAKLKEHHEKMAQNHIRAALHMTKKDPTLWKHLTAALHEDKPFVMSAASAMHPDAHADKEDHLDRIQSHIWDRHKEDFGRHYEVTMGPSKGRMATPKEIAGHFKEHISVKDPREALGEGESAEFHPGSGHKADKLIGF